MASSGPHRGSGVELRAFFHGRALNAVDAKGRVSLPADMREVVGARAREIARTSGEHVSDRHVYLAAHPDLPCLRGFDMGFLPELFAKARRAVSELPAAEQEQALEMAQLDLFAELEKAAFDDPGRLVIPPQARRLGGIGSQALFLGAGETFQVWDPQTYLDCSAIADRAKQAVRMLVEARG